ncbi:hypothetical protein [Mycobacterium spongiae]|uniref:Uncharacterized protein n=1 Tax=Mycobacterium spongiae TaxID=886343 RepID=A0A975JXT7_9MYCO|nr:hypothetical protein [Mycobacterium spongiae]QUR67682.1 hypothetical protein F6B93_11740 [Mycobacterium spongiae]
MTTTSVRPAWAAHQQVPACDQGPEHGRSFPVGHGEDGDNVVASVRAPRRGTCREVADDDPHDLGCQ